MNRWIVPTVIVVVILLIATQVAQPRTQTGQLSMPTPISSPLPTAGGLLPEASAITRGVELAKQLGLQGEPWGVGARLMTRREAAQLDGGDIPDGAGKVGIDPNQPVWVIVVRGAVDLRGSATGLRPGDRTEFDNMILHIDAQTGQLVSGPGARNPGVSLPIPVSVTPGSPTEVPVVISPRPVVTLAAFPTVVSVPTPQYVPTIIVPTRAAPLVPTPYRGVDET